MHTIVFHVIIYRSLNRGELYFSLIKIIISFDTDVYMLQVIYSHPLQNSQVRHYEYHLPVKFSSFLEIKGDLKMCKNCLFQIKVDFKVDLKLRANFVSCLEIKVVFSKFVRIPVLYLPTMIVAIKSEPFSASKLN